MLSSVDGEALGDGDGGGLGREDGLFFIPQVLPPKANKITTPQTTTVTQSGCQFRSTMKPIIVSIDGALSGARSVYYAALFDGPLSENLRAAGSARRSSRQPSI